MGSVSARRISSWPWPLDNTGIDRHHAVCEDCNWTCHVTPHKSKEVAQRCMERHVVYHHPLEERDR